MLFENLLHWFPAGVALKGSLLTHKFVIGHHSVRIETHYYNVIQGFTDIALLSFKKDKETYLYIKKHYVFSSCVFGIISK